jgi:hypothetical protein
MSIDYPFCLRLKNKFDPIINLNSIYTYPAGRHVLEKVYENENEISKISTDNLKNLNTKKFKLQLIELYVIPHETKWIEATSSHCGYPAFDTESLTNYSPEMAPEGSTKLYFIYGGDSNSKIEWFKLENVAAKNVTYFQPEEKQYFNIETASHTYKIDDCKLLHNSLLINSMFINVSLLHRINNSNSYKKLYIISCMFEDKEYEIENNINNEPTHYIRSLTMKQASQIYKQIIEE